MNHRLLMAAALLAGTSAPLSAQSVMAGIKAWQHSDYNGAVRIWRPLADKGDPDAQFNLGQAYRVGRGVPIDLSAAQKWLQRAALQGHVDAQTTLGLLLFENGNRAMGTYWLKAAAAKNDPRAMLVYGAVLFNGDGVKRDAIRGYAYVSRAAAAGLATAKDTLAEMDASLPPEIKTKAAALIAGGTPHAKGSAAKAHAAKPARVEAAPVRLASNQANPSKAAPAGPAAPKATAHSGGWRIQLGAFGQRGSAEALFRKLSGSSALSGRSPVYVPAGAVIRLQIGPFESRSAAASACAALRGQACFPVPAK